MPAVGADREAAEARDDRTWSREALDRKTRSLCSIGILTAWRQDPNRLEESPGVGLYASARSFILHTVFQLRSVIGTPSNFSALAASLDLPTPSGAWR